MADHGRSRARTIHFAARCAITLAALAAILAHPGAAMAQSIRPPASGPGSINGIVIGLETRQAIADATVVLEGSNATATTTGSGRFTFDSVPAGDAVLVVKARGYMDLKTQAILIRPGTVSGVTVELSKTTNFMDVLQVTASKSLLSIGDIASQATVIDKDLMTRSGDRSIPDAVDHTPGAIVSRQLGIFDSVMLRGMPRGDPEFTNTALLVDGVPQTLSNNGARALTIPTYDAGSIEVVRGPNSALYGRTAIGGAINMLTANPTATHEVGFDLTGGQFQTAVGSLYASGPVRDWGGYYVSVAGTHEGGYFVNKTSTNFDQGNGSFFGKLTFAPGPKAFGSVSVARVSSNNSTPTNEPIIDGQLLHVIDPQFDRLSNMNIPGPNYKQGEWRTTFNYTRQLSPNVRMIEVLGYRDYRQQFIDDGDFIGTPFSLAASTITMYPFNQDRNENILYEEFRLETTPGTSAKDSLLFGGSYEMNRGHQTQSFIFLPTNPDGFTINYITPVIPARSTWLTDGDERDYDLDIAAAFVQYTIEPTPRVILTGAGRFDHFGLDNTFVGEDTVEDSFSAFSPKASATFRLTDGKQGGNARPIVNIYGAYSHAFLPPHPPNGLTIDDAESDLTPVDVDNIEGGVKGTAYDGRLSFEGTYFWMHEDGVVLEQHIPNTPDFEHTNAGVRKYRGLETGVSWVQSPKVTFHGNASFYHNRFGEFVNKDEVWTGNRLPIAPDYVINWGAVLHPFTANPNPLVSPIEILFDVKHVGEVVTDNQNSFTLDPYTLVDVAGSWRWGKLRVTLSAHNLLNSLYYGNGDTETADPGRPRQVLLTTSVKLK